MQVKKYGYIGRSEFGTIFPTDIEKYHTSDYSNYTTGTFCGIASEDISINGKYVVNKDTVFAYAGNGIDIITKIKCDLMIISRFDYKGQTVLGVPVEEKGRLKYIDGCTDSVLIYPPKLGDPCVNHLHFPKGVDQTFHTHPSIRMGYVLRGSGVACLKDGEIELTTGDIFCIDVDELHRFRTTDSSMDIIAYHPDSDVGPTDEDHPMLNKTIIHAAS